MLIKLYVVPPVSWYLPVRFSVKSDINQCLTFLEFSRWGFVPSLRAEMRVVWIIAAVLSKQPSLSGTSRAGVEIPLSILRMFAEREPQLPGLLSSQSATILELV